MTPPTERIAKRELTEAEEAQVQAALERLRQIAELLGQREQLFDERLQLFRRLLGLGVYQRVVGRAAGVSDDAVAMAVAKARREERERGSG